jgi:hypothetical protein
LRFELEVTHEVFLPSPKFSFKSWSKSGDQWIWGKVLSRVHSLNPFSGGEGLIFWRRSFGKRFFWSTCEAMVIISWFYGVIWSSFGFFSLPHEVWNFTPRKSLESPDFYSGLFTPNFYFGKSRDSRKVWRLRTFQWIFPRLVWLCFRFASKLTLTCS